MLKISAIIMASGFSKRMGVNKLFLNYQGRTFLEHIVDFTKTIDFYERILVISPDNLEGVSLPEGIKVVLNHEANQGQSASVRLGTQLASGDGYLYLTVDQPLLNKALFRSLQTAYTKENIVFPVNENDDPSSPVYFGNQFRTELLNVSGTVGGRQIRNKYPEACYKVKLSEPKLLADIDTFDDYQQLIEKIVDERKEL